MQVAGTAQAATEILCLMNMVTKEELEDDEEYEGADLYTCITVLGTSIPSLLPNFIHKPSVTRGLQEVVLILPSIDFFLLSCCYV